MKLAQSKVHFIGIGGIGMCGLAELLHNMGAQVTGSDLGENAQTERLKKLGIPIFKGHSQENLGEAEVVVYSSAVKPDNPEYAKARQDKVPLIPRAEALAELMRLKRGIAVAGTHGKTTTTSLISSLFLSAQQDPTIVIGGRLDLIQSTAQLGKGEWLIAEADESDGSFNRLSPEIVIITNIDNDHLDHYRDFRTLQNAFLDFASRIPFYGALVICGDDEKTRELFRNFAKPIIWYGESNDNDVIVRGARGQYELVREGKVLGSYQVPLAGRHNGLNAAAAIISSMQAGLSFTDCANGIAQFRGVDRRFQKRSDIKGVSFYDDYGHHPTEISATLAGFKEHFPDRRLVVLFQPHRYSRTQLCWQQFLTCFADADELFVMDIYPAGEAAIRGVDTKTLVSQLDHPSCHYCSNPQEILSVLRSGDVFLTLGAGDVYKIGEKLAKAYDEK